MDLMLEAYWIAFLHTSLSTGKSILLAACLLSQVLTYLVTQGGFLDLNWPVKLMLTDRFA